MVKFVKYLPDFGYVPLILTTKTYGCLPDDADRLTFRGAAAIIREGMRQRMD